MEEHIETYSNKFNVWISCINKFTNFVYSTEELTKDEEFKIVTSTANTFAEILKSFIDYGKYKDTWEEPTFMFGVYSLYTEVNSIKTNQKYEMGVDEKGVYIQTYVTHSSYLKNMKDEFWSLVLELSSLGEFEFIEHSHFSKEVRIKHPQLFRLFKGNIFKIMRKYFLSEFLYPDDIDLGSFRVQWKHSVDFAVIFENSTIAFRNLYKLNYALWKVSQLQSNGD